jgi:hypothetical protein
MKTPGIKLTLEHANALAKQKGGPGAKCISKEYINNCSDLEWQCSKGHRWFTTLQKVQMISPEGFCPHCSGRIITIKNLHDVAESHGGECLFKGVHWN